VELKLLAISYGDTKPPCYTSAYNWFRQYRESNFNPMVLVKKPSTRPRGKQLCKATHIIIRDHINTLYLQRTHPNIKSLHAFIKAFIENENKARLDYTSDVIDTPSLSTVYRTIKNLNGYLLDFHHHGREYAAKTHKFGVKQAPLHTLLALVEGDSHLVDLELIDQNGNNLGRPWLFVLIELMTRCIIGWELSFTPPCAAKVLRAFRMALEVSIDGRPGGRMEELVLDNGMETANHTIQNIADLLGFKITYGPPGCPNVKAHVERFFGTLNTSLIHSIPGTTFSNPVQRGDYNSEKNACLTIEQLNEQFSNWVQNVYHDSYHSGINQSPRMAWTAALAMQLPPEHYSKDDVNALCRSLTYRKLANGRVRFSKISWTGPALAEIAHHLRSNQKALVYYDLTDLSTVWVAHPDRPTELFEAFATEPGYQNHLSLFEHELVLAQLKEQHIAFNESTARQTLTEIHRKIQQISEERKLTSKKSLSSKFTKKTSVQKQSIQNTNNSLTPPPSSRTKVSTNALKFTDESANPSTYTVINLRDVRHE